MKWFKHDSGAHSDAKVKKLRHRFGISGFGLYMYCIERIAATLDSKNVSFVLEEDAETIAIEWRMDEGEVQRILDYMVELKLFGRNRAGQITCFKLAKRLDDTHSKNPEIRKILNALENLGEVQDISDFIGDSPKQSEELRETPRNSENVGETPNVSDQIRLDQISLEQITEEKTLPASDHLDVENFERFWEAGMRKVEKKTSFAAFRRLLKGMTQPERHEFTCKLVADIKKRISLNQFGFDSLHPTTYLNGERWNDEYPRPESRASPSKSNIFDLTNQNYASGDL